MYTSSTPRWYLSNGRYGSGDVWVPSVDENGDLSWTLNSKTPPKTVNIKGPKGDPGDFSDFESATTKDIMDLFD